MPSAAQNGRDDRDTNRSATVLPGAVDGPSSLQETLRRPDEYFEQIVSGVRDYSILILDPRGRIQTWNAGAERVYGYRPAEIVGQHFSRFSPDEALRRGLPQDELHVAASSGRFENEGWRIRKDGTRFWASIVITPLFKEDGRLRAFLKITRDLSERKQAEEALRQSEERFRHLVEGVADYAIFMLDPDGQIATWNVGAERIKGYAPEEIIGRHFSVFYPQEAIERRWPEYELKVASEEGRFEDEGWRVRKDGTRFWANVVITAVRGDDGRLRGFSKVTRDLTERKRTEDELRRSRALLEERVEQRTAELSRANESLQRSEERYRDLVAAMPAAVYTTDREGRITLYNDHAADLWGRRPELGRDLWCGSFRIFRPDGTPLRHEECPMAITLREGRPVRGQEIIVERPDGTRACVLPCPEPLRDVSGQIIGAVNVLVDISDRKRAEESLRERERQLQLVTDSAPVLIAHCDRDQRFKFVNRGYAERFGMQPQDVIGRPITDVLGEEAFKVIAPHVEAALAGNRVTYEAEIPYRSIASQHMLCAYQPEFDDSGDVVGYVAAITNITERKRMEWELADEARTNETLYRIGRTLAAELDLQQIVQTVTDEATSLTGAQFGAFFYNVTSEQGESYTLYTISGVSREAFARFPLPRNTALFEPTFRGQGTVRLDDVARDPRYGGNAPYHGMPEGHLPVTSYLAVPVVSRSGEVLGGLFFGHANAGVFTARHERLVEGIASQASVAIDNARLYGSLKEADRRKDEFLALLGHELRNPLAAIVNGVQVLQSPRARDDQAARVRSLIERQARHMTHLVDDLLDVTRISRGKVVLRKERLDLVELLEKVIEDHRTAVDESGCLLDLRLPGHPVCVDADSTRLHQLLGNLLQNACKFTDAGRRITVTLQADTARQQAVVSVQDTGIGMTRETLNRLFVPFNQADSSLDRSRGGLGLGLALVRGLVELHGGTVTARSPGLGEGSEFTVLLPLATSPANGPQHAPRPSDGERTAFRVLVVEDSAPVAEIFAVMLRDAGHEVEVVPGGEEALEKIPAYRPQIVFSDISMPKMSGYDFARRIREQPDLRHLVLVAMTGYGQQEDRERALQAGFDHHLVKPADIDQLRSLFDALASRGTSPA